MRLPDTLPTDLVVLVAEDDTFARNLIRRMLETIGVGTVLTAGQGCPACDHTGFRGRVGCFEFMVVNDDVRRAITEGAGSAQVRAAARAAGWRPLQEQARDLALAGTTSPEEVLRATDAEPEDAPSAPAAPAPAETTDR